MPVADVESQAPNDGATWWCKILVKGCGVLAALICGICAILNLVSLLHPICIGAGIIMFLISFTLIFFEAPICCAYFDKDHTITSWINQRVYWQKGLIYVLFSIVPMAMCPGVASLIGCICPFAVGVIYGLMSLGKKADRGEMLAKASTNQFSRFENESGS